MHDFLYSFSILYLLPLRSPWLAILTWLGRVGLIGSVEFLVLTPTRPVGPAKKKTPGPGIPAGILR